MRELDDKARDAARWMISFGFVMLSATKHLGDRGRDPSLTLRMTIRGRDDKARVGVVFSLPWCLSG